MTRGAKPKRQLDQPCLFPNLAGSFATFADEEGDEFGVREGELIAEEAGGWAGRGGEKTRCGRWRRGGSSAMLGRDRVIVRRRTEAWLGRRDGAGVGVSCGGRSVAMPHPAAGMLLSRDEREAPSALLFVRP